MRADSPMIEAIARATAVPGSARKARLVLDLIRRKSAVDAISLLQNTNRTPARVIEKVLRSAIANAQTQALNDAKRIDEDRLHVSEAFADDGPARKIHRGGRRSRIRRIRRRTTHYTIRVTAHEEE